MSNLIPFEGTTNLPAHLADMGASNSDLSNGVGGGGFPHISYKGKVWHVIDGDSNRNDLRRYIAAKLPAGLPGAEQETITDAIIAKSGGTFQQSVGKGQAEND